MQDLPLSWEIFGCAQGSGALPRTDYCQEVGASLLVIRINLIDKAEVRPKLKFMKKQQSFILARKGRGLVCSAL